MHSLHHPKALFWLSLTYALFMVSVGSIVASLVLYQTNALNLSFDQAYNIYATAMAMMWILPLGGGYLSTKLGYVNASRMGLICATIGLGILAIQQLEAFYVGIALFMIGNAFATPAIWCLVDHCYSKTSYLREAGFTLFYLAFNFAGMIGIFFGGYLAETVGFGFEFGFNAICALASLFVLHTAEHKITSHRGRSIRPQVKWSTSSIWACLALTSIVSLPVIIGLFENVAINNVLTIVLTVGVAFILFRIAFKQRNKKARNKIIAFIGLSLIAIVYWTLYSLEPSFISVYISDAVNTSFLGIKIPASSFFAFDNIFVVLVGLALSRLWLILAERNRNPTLPVKFTSALFVIGFTFCALSFVARQMGDTLMPSYVIVFTYAFLATAELLISPLGISMVGRLAPEGQEGLMMGFWQVCIGMGGVFSGYIATAPYFPKDATLSETNVIYSDVFLSVGVAGVFAALIITSLVKKLKRLITEEPLKIPRKKAVQVNGKKES